jgi:hypothetical protein
MVMQKSLFCNETMPLAKRHASASIGERAAVEAIMFSLEIAYTSSAVDRPSSGSYFVGPDNAIETIIKSLHNNAEVHGGEYVDSSSLGEYLNTIGLHEKHRSYFPQEVQEFLSNYAYVFAGAGGLLVFLRNGTGLIKDAIDIIAKYKGGNASIKVKWKGESISLKDGDNLEAAIAKIEEVAKIDPSPYANISHATKASVAI